MTSHFAVSRIKADAARIYDALEAGRRVLVARHGQVVAAIDPCCSVAPGLLVDYVVPGRRRLPELTASEINQGSPSRAVSEASAGDARYVTKDGQVYGVLRPISGEELAAEIPSTEEAAELSRRIEDYLSAHPDATAEDLVELTSGPPADVVILGDGQPGDAQLKRRVQALAETVERLKKLTTDVTDSPSRALADDPHRAETEQAIVETAAAAASQAALVARFAGAVGAGARA